MSVNLRRRVAIKRRERKYLNDIDRIIINSRKYPHLKARLIGYFMGDGSVTKRSEKNGKIHCTCNFFPDDVSMRNSFLESFLKIYEFSPKVEPLHNHERIRFDSKAIVDDLLSYGSFRSLEWQLPSFKTQKETTEWLKAFFDCEAYVSPRGIVLQSVNKNGLLQIATALANFSIETRFYQYVRKNKNWNINYILTINKKEHVRRFYKQIGFNHNKKQKRCQRILTR